MADPTQFARIELKTPEISFVAEGTPEWLAAQLDKVLAMNQQPKPAPRPSGGPLTPG